jgi:hypothetical protein
MFKVLDLIKEDDIEFYKSIIRNYDFQSAYNRLEYFDVFSGGKENLICFYYEEDEEIILLPGYLKQIEIYGSLKGKYDFITPYGYTGPFCSNKVKDSTIDSFWKIITIWQLNNNVVSEFIRFNLFNNSRGYIGNLHDTMLNIKGTILSEDNQWKAFDAKVRKNVKRAVRENLTSRIYFKNIEQYCINEFYEIYIDTMKRTNAKEFFFYSLESFNYFIFNNLDLCAICTIYDNDKCISSELLLISNNSVFSFLGGTVIDAFEKRPNDFLKFEVINWARSKGFKYYILGGGYGYEDGIFKYKKAFFPNDVVKYVTGRKIVDQQKYFHFVNEVNSKMTKNDFLNFDDNSFFPLYNKK